MPVRYGPAIESIEIGLGIDYISFRAYLFKIACPKESKDSKFIGFSM